MVINVSKATATSSSWQKTSSLKINAIDSSHDGETRKDTRCHNLKDHNLNKSYCFVSETDVKESNNDSRISTNRHSSACLRQVKIKPNLRITSFIFFPQLKEQYGYFTCLARYVMFK